MVLARADVHPPLGHLRAEIRLLVLRDQPVSDVGDVELLPIELAGIGGEECFHIVQELLDLDFVGRELDLPAVAEAILDAGPASGGLILRRLEAAPIADDLVELLLPILAAIAVLVGVLLHELPPILGRLRVLPAVLEDLRQLSQGLDRQLRLWPRRRFSGGDLLKNLDVVELVGQVESLDAGGQPGYRLIFSQGVQGVRAALVFLRVIGGHASESPAVLGHRLHAELVQRELRQFPADSVEVARVELSRLLETPSPALAVILGRFKTLRHGVEDGVAIGVDRRTRAFAVVSPAVFIIGQDVEIGESLQPPRFAIASIV